MAYVVVDSQALPKLPRGRASKLLTGLVRSPEQAAIALILVFFAFHMALAFTLGLGVDECYSIGVSHDLELSYFDHPPLHYWIAHFAMPLFGDGRALRIPFVVMFMATTWTLYLLTRQLAGAAAGVWAVVAVNLSAFFTAAGGWILPDGPLMLSVVAAAYTISLALFPRDRPPSPWRTWILAGLWIGLAGLSKYHAVLFVAGLLLYILSVPQRRRILLHPAPWLGAAVALAMISPVIVWNAEHHWASIAFQGGRVRGENFPQFGHLLLNVGGQMVWMLPWIFVPMVIAASQALRRGRSADSGWYCLCLAMPIIVVITAVPLWGDRGLPHWQMPGWLLLFPVLGDYLAREAAKRSRPYTWAKTSAALLVLFAFLIDGHAATGYGRLLFPAAFAKGDPTLEAYQWMPLQKELLARGLLERRGLFIISNSWIDAGKIDQALHDTVPIQIFGRSQQYAFRNDPKSFVGRDALIIGRRERINGIDKALAGYFESIDELPPFAFGRNGLREVDVRMFYGRGLKKALPLGL